MFSISVALGWPRAQVLKDKWYMKGNVLVNTLKRKPKVGWDCVQGRACRRQAVVSWPSVESQDPKNKLGGGLTAAEKRGGARRERSPSRR